jgi:hypothetical protein
MLFRKSNVRASAQPVDTGASLHAQNPAPHPSVILQVGAGSERAASPPRLDGERAVVAPVVADGDHGVAIDVDQALEVADRVAVRDRLALNARA